MRKPCRLVLLLFVMVFVLSGCYLFDEVEKSVGDINEKIDEAYVDVTTNLANLVSEEEAEVKVEDSNTEDRDAVVQVSDEKIVVSEGSQSSGLDVLPASEPKERAKVYGGVLNQPIFISDLRLRLWHYLDDFELTKEDTFLPESWYACDVDLLGQKIYPQLEMSMGFAYRYDDTPVKGTPLRPEGGGWVYELHDRQIVHGSPRDYTYCHLENVTSLDGIQGFSVDHLEQAQYKSATDELGKFFVCNVRFNGHVIAEAATLVIEEWRYNYDEDRAMSFEEHDSVTMLNVIENGMVELKRPEFDVHSICSGHFDTEGFLAAYNHFLDEYDKKYGSKKPERTTVEVVAERNDVDTRIQIPSYSNLTIDKVLDFEYPEGYRNLSRTRFLSILGCGIRSGDDLLSTEAVLLVGDHWDVFNANYSRYSDNWSVTVEDTRDFKIVTAKSETHRCGGSEEQVYLKGFTYAIELADGKGPWDDGFTILNGGNTRRITPVVSPDSIYIDQIKFAGHGGHLSAGHPEDGFTLTHLWGNVYGIGGKDLPGEATFKLYD